MTKRIILFLCIFLFLVGQILALGITPGRTSLNFEPGLSKEVSFKVINSDKKDMNVVITSRGEMAQYITLNEVYGELSKEEDSKTFSYVLNLPYELSEPGNHEAEIVVFEMPKNFLEEGTTVGATVAVISQVFVHVPYPNKYIDADLEVFDGGGKVGFTIPIINRGGLDISEVTAKIKIYNWNDEFLGEVSTPSKSVKSLERTELYGVWETGAAPGKYKAEVEIRFDDFIKIISEEFSKGEVFVEVVEINVKDFRLGEIAKFNAIVNNKWSSELKDVYFLIEVYQDNGILLADFESPTYDVGPLTKGELIAYWDTNGIRVGNYNGKLILNYAEKSSERNIKLKIEEDSIEVVGLTGKVIVQDEGSNLNMENILYIVVGVLVVANVIWFVLIRRILNKRRKK